MISKTLSTSQKRAALHQVVPDLAEFCQQLYPLLVAHADDFGRLSGDAFTVKHAIDPTSPRSLADFERGLQALHDVHLIAWYQVKERRFIQIGAFDHHQIGLHKRTASIYPEPPGYSGNFPEVKAETAPVPSLPLELKGTELKGTEPINDSPEAASGSGPTSSPTVLEFETVGADGHVWHLTEAHVAGWVSLFPTIDVLQESRNALAWVQANPGRRKTVSGMARFLVRWFTKATDDGRSAQPHASICPERAKAAAS